MQYRVIDLAKTIVPEQIVTASTPEKAAQIALGEELVRSGHKSALRARVYWQVPGQPTNMVRLYTMAADRTIQPDGTIELA